MVFKEATIIVKFSSNADDISDKLDLTHKLEGIGFYDIFSIKVESIQIKRIKP